MFGKMIRTLVVASLLAVGVTPSGPIKAAPRDQALFRGRVIVGEDANGVSSATFPTTVAGEEVRYLMLIDNGISNGGRARPPVAAMQITLNNSLVWQSSDLFLNDVVEVTLNPSGVLNQIGLQATGTPGSGASVIILALEPTARLYGGRSVLPWVGVGAEANFLTVHNAGPSPLVYRVLFFNPDGTLAGQTPSAALNGYAALTLNGTAIVANHGIQWQAGAVHIRWVSNGMTRMSAVATNTTHTRELALDDYGPFPITRQQFEDVAGAQIIPQ